MSKTITSGSRRKLCLMSAGLSIIFLGACATTSQSGQEENVTFNNTKGYATVTFSKTDNSCKIDESLAAFGTDALETDKTSIKLELETLYIKASAKRNIDDYVSCYADPVIFHPKAGQHYNVKLDSESCDIIITDAKNRRADADVSKYECPPDNITSTSGGLGEGPTTIE